MKNNKIQLDDFAYYDELNNKFYFKHKDKIYVPNPNNSNVTIDKYGNIEMKINKKDFEKWCKAKKRKERIEKLKKII